ncbi:phage tail assembly chaperone G [Caldibacillus thermoamylovorans]|uniref:phage tail assembly chaperone G n=1 Tax=Caldibacillus thermoamylovorans TaxID=35841 RepID=UPI0022E0925A|nr:hypothetical protein [Caldibacillus thermoamylovorans]
MQIELYIDGKKKLFTTPFVPMLAKRKYLEVLAKAEQRETTSTIEQLQDDDEIYSILTDIVFKGQFTLDQLYNGNSIEYIQMKMREAIFGIKEDDGGNEKGK